MIAIAADSLRTEINGGGEIQGLPLEAAAVQSFLLCTQLQVAMAGAVAGLLLDARAYDVSRGQLSPLSALSQTATKQPAAGTQTHTQYGEVLRENWAGIQQNVSDLCHDRFKEVFAAQTKRRANLQDEDVSKA
ncbi:fructose symporter [Sporothrix curviconia]|uniref:Fructose symporter n=1 Tax=Sporothrix curviconia TaxID=1260050 RepID=A0ABP0BXP4_9PEZI